MPESKNPKKGDVAVENKETTNRNTSSSGEGRDHE